MEVVPLTLVSTPLDYSLYYWLPLYGNSPSSTGFRSMGLVSLSLASTPRDSSLCHCLQLHGTNIVHLHPVAHCYYTFTFFFRLCAACQCLKHFSVLNTCHFKIFKITTCFGLNWPSSGVNSRFLRRLLLFYSVMLVRPFVFRVCL
jgi:hypothetical protein